MTKPKPKRLKYMGTVSEVRDDDGNVVSVQADRYFGGVPARDLAETDLADLGDERVKEIMGGPDPLYTDPDADKPAAKKPASKSAGSRSGSKKATAKAATPVTADEPFEPTPVADENTAGNPFGVGDGNTRADSEPGGE